MNLKDLGEKRVTQSRFAFTQSSNKKNHLYHSLLTNLISLDNSQENILEALKEGDKNIAELVNRGSEKGLEELIQNGFIVSPGVNEPSKLREHFKEKLKVDFGMMYLLVTDSCNLRCKYCFVENPLPLNHKFSLMSPELAKRGIDLFVDNITQNKDVRKNVCIYGGEPLINRETVHETISHIRKNHKDKELNIQLITNGTLMTPETARILSEGNVDVAVLIDGPEEITNFVRPMTSKGDTYKKIKSAWKTLRNAGHKNLSISLTLTSSNVPNLRSNIEKIVEEFKPNGFGFNFLLGNPCDLNGCSVDMDYTTNQVIETFKYLRNMGIPEDRMMRKIKAFVKKIPISKIVEE